MAAKAHFCSSHSRLKSEKSAILGNRTVFVSKPKINVFLKKNSNRAAGPEEEACGLRIFFSKTINYRL